MDAMDTIGAHPLKIARRELELTQEDVAIATMLTSQTIKRAEKGERLSPYVISQLCKYFSEQYHREVTPQELGLKKQQRSNERSDNTHMQRNEEGQEPEIPMLKSKDTSTQPDEVMHIMNNLPPNLEKTIY